MMTWTKRFYWLFLFMLAFQVLGYSQCQVYDGGGNVTATPTWVSCTGGAFTLYVQSPNNLGYLIINWGDGSPNTVVNGLIPPAFVSHPYAAAIANYNVTITDTTNNCTINGLVVMEEPVNASIQIPIGGVTTICAPNAMLFTNSSTDVSSNTTFTWDFGDGTPIITYGDTNAGQTVSHTYEQGTVDCVTEVLLTAENYCSFGNPTEASFNPIQIYDIDDAEVTPDNILLCYPDTIVHYDNTTAKNCVPEGNTAQRFEYWNFGDYWGLGYDSIIDWTPFDPPAKPGYDIAYPGLGTYTVMMADSNLCGRDTAYATIQIVDPPTAGLAIDVDSACTGELVTFTNLSTGGNQTLINYGDGGGFQGMGATSTHTYTTAGTYTVLLVVNITGGTDACTDTIGLPLVILPSPNAVATIAPNGGCDTVTASFINSSSGGAFYFWTFGNGDTSSLQNPPPIVYTTQGPTQVILDVTSNNGCTNSDTATVHVYDTPNVSFGLQNVCEDEVASFLDSTTVGYGGPITTWNWSFGDTANGISTIQNPTFTYVDSGTYTITLIASSAYCSDSLSQTIYVEPKPFARFQESDSNGCSPLTVAFNNLSTGASTYLWDFGDGNTSTQQSPTYTFVHTALSDTFFVVKLISMSTFGCVDSTFDTINVLGNPISSYVSDAVLDCAPLEVNFSDSSDGAISWIWDFGDSTGSTAQNPTHIFENTTQFITNYTVNLIVTAPNGCTDTSSQSITVYPEPLYNFTMVPDEGCSPLQVQFPVAVGAVLYDWDFGDGNTASGPNPTHTFYNNTTNNQTFNITLVATTPFGCVDTAYGSVTVFPNPTAAVTPPLTQECGPHTVNFTNNSTGGSSYTWIFGNGDTLVSNAASVSAEFTNNTNDTAFFYPFLVATTLNGCNDTDTVDVHIFKQIISSFSVNDSSCHPHAATFTDLSTNATNWAWDFDDGFTSNQQNPQHTFINLGTTPVIRNVVLTAGSIEGCADDSTVTVTILPKPLSSFNIVNSPACHDEPVQINNNSQQNLINTWEFGAGTANFIDNNASIDTVFTNMTNNTSTRVITLLVENAYGCTDTSNLDMVVYPFLEAKFAGADEGCSPLEVKFFNQSTGGNLFEWTFGDGNNSFFDEPTHTFVNTDSIDVVYTVTLEVQSIFGCTDEAELDVLVRATPEAQFIVNPTFQRFPDATVTLDNLSSDGPWSFDWQFGDGDTSALEEPTTHEYATWGEYTILLTANSEFCQDTISRDITIEPPFPIAVFDTVIVGCAPVTVDFLSNSEYAVTWLWEFGDGASSSSSMPTYTYQFPGTYDVKLTVTGPGGDTDSEEVLAAVVVHAQPLASFVYAPSEVRVPNEPVTFVNYSQFADNYFWDFGDTVTSREESPQHYYKEAGNFFPTLVASTNEGCADTMTSVVPVVGLVEGVLEVPNAFIPSPTGASDGLFDPFAITNQVFFPILTGVTSENYLLSVFNRWGELLFETENINQGWNGYYRGKICQQDVYVWRVKGEYVSGEKFTKVGDVTLIQ